MPNDYLTNPQPKHAFVYVCTIQRMAVNLFGRQAVWSGEEEGIDDDAGPLLIPIHAFDVIIADECHRGYTTAEMSVWRDTLDHFDAVKIGLTATPAAHTKAYFREVVFRYEYARAVREGYLVDYDVVNIKSNVRIKGVFLKAGESVQVVDPETGNERLDVLEDERDFESTEVERSVTSPDSNRKILEEVKKFALEHEQRYGRFPKTLIFAANDLSHTSHADQLVELAVAVSSEYHIRSGTGKDFKPEDYLTAFSRFVQENAEQVEAIGILLDRPLGWSTAALDELKRKLAGAPDGFTVETLQKAHQVCYKKSLVDIISVVKHAARDQEPLLTAEERVDRAFRQVTADREFTDEQQQWLERIRVHLIENLSIDREDFDDLPVFARHGGWARADRDFEGRLAELVTAVNEAVAA